MIRDYFAGLPPSEYPNLARLADEMFDIGVDERFELGLEILVRGLAALAEGQGAGGVLTRLGHRGSRSS
jgi:hypothetical protein